MPRSRLAPPALLLVACSTAFAACAAPRGDRLADSTAVAGVAVHVGGDGPEVDACSLGAVQRHAGTAAAAIIVRAGPGEEFPAVDSVASGTMVHTCEIASGWVGIVYRLPTDPADPTEDCGGLASPVAARKPYDGPCRAGWVPAEAHEVIAG
jgi:hypothetical protein